MMLLLLQPSCGEIGLSCLGAVLLRSPLATQNNFDFCSFFLHGSIQGAGLTLGFMVGLERVFMQNTHCAKHSPLCSIAIKPYLMYSRLCFRFDIAKNYFVNLLINLLQPSVWYN